MIPPYVDHLGMNVTYANRTTRKFDHAPSFDHVP